MPVQEFTTEELKSEEWRDVPDYEGYYRVSSLGRILSLKDRFKREREHPIKASPNPNGRLMFTICKDAMRRPIQVHILVALAFLGPRPEGYEINHLNGNYQDNRRANLEYCTPEENKAHAKRMKLTAVGDRNAMRKYPEKVPRGDSAANAKLTEDIVAQIKSLNLLYGQAAFIAKRLNVTATIITRIFQGKIWRHVTAAPVTAEWLKRLPAKPETPVSRTRLSRIDVDEMKRLYKPRQYGYEAIAKQFGVSVNTARSAIQGTGLIYSRYA